ncbi:hypothetical protein [Staphylococcus capitis]|uniref:Uncharacterized protein n=1 Tax=Staphylococcus capitis TaxID=29388 RepID=A0ABX1SQT0_STACP|nr:hypothetical protein [Staphylococcus capitis]NMK54664.1 hypothetical protein [Staphylococcus capitis]NMK62355.1 hypothetical protein [Staphylococcus capitis]NMK69906.1 hypothetical protein [Staphylococcus capitis]NMK72738.1 hypothetical protein [Staphylococcus capitis]NMK78994.1 hypothetical protein [Staphylococcus capitis]
MITMIGLSLLILISGIGFICSIAYIVIVSIQQEAGYSRELGSGMIWSITFLFVLGVSIFLLMCAPL